MKLKLLACLALVFGVTAGGVMAQLTTGGLATSAPTSGQFCVETAPNGSSVRYPAKPMSIDWRGKTYAFTGSVWSNQTRERYQALSAALKAARASDAPLDLGRGGITAVRSTASGVLVATDDGEWGGAVWFIAPGGGQQKVVDSNTVGLFDLGSSLVALTGLAHMTLDYGTVFRLDLAGPTPSAMNLANLSGAPQAWAAADGVLLVATGHGGVAVLADGTVEPASVNRLCTGLAGLRQ